MSIPYRIIADCFRDREVIPFLGSAASFVGAPPDQALPDGNKFATILSEKSSSPGLTSDPLTKIAQYLEEVPADRKYLLNEVADMFCDHLDRDYRSAFTDFLLHLKREAVPEL